MDRHARIVVVLIALLVLVLERLHVVRIPSLRGPVRQIVRCIVIVPSWILTIDYLKLGRRVGPFARFDRIILSLLDRRTISRKPRYEILIQTPSRRLVSLSNLGLNTLILRRTEYILIAQQARPLVHIKIADLVVLVLHVRILVRIYRELTRVYDPQSAAVVLGPVHLLR